MLLFYFTPKLSYLLSLLSSDTVVQNFEVTLENKLVPSSTFNTGQYVCIKQEYLVSIFSYGSSLFIAIILISAKNFLLAFFAVIRHNGAKRPS